MLIAKNLVITLGFQRPFVNLTSYLVVPGEMAVRYGDGGGRLDCIDQSVIAVRHGHVVDPNIGGAEQGDAVAVALHADSEVIQRVPDEPAVPGVGVVDVDAVDDYVLHELQGDLGPIADVHVGAAAVDRLVVRHDELFREPDDHVVGEYDPQRFGLDHAKA